MTRVAVVGAGWSGMAAAVELASAGCQVDLYEAARHVGGRARRVVFEGITLDNGQHILLGAYAETLRLIRLTGGDERDLMRRLPLELTYPGEFTLCAPTWLPAPLHLLYALLAARGLAWRDKIAALGFMHALRMTGFRVVPDVTVAEFLLRHRQTLRARAYLWDPLCVAALNTAPEIASAQVFATVLCDTFSGARSDSDLLIPRVDLSSLFPDPALNYVLERGGVWHPGMQIDALVECDGRIMVCSGAAGSEFEAVVCALPPPRAAALFRGSSESALSLQRLLEAFEFEPIVTCYLQYPARVRLPRPMIGLSAAISQWAFDRGVLGGPAGLIAVVVSAAGRLRGLAGDALAEEVHRELEAVLPSLPRPLRQQVIVEKRATFRCTPNLLRPRTQGPCAGLFFAGDHVADPAGHDYPATLEGAVRSGVAAARAALTYMAGLPGRSIA